MQDKQAAANSRDGRSPHDTPSTYTSLYVRVIHLWMGSRYNRLLFVLLTLFISRFLWREMPFGALLFAGFTLILLLILISSRLFDRRGRWLFFALSGLAFFTQLSAYLLPHLTEVTLYESPLTIVGLSINVIFFGMSAYLITEELFIQDSVNADSLKGGICAYVLIGIAWSFLYQMSVLTNPNSIQVTCNGCSLDTLYFSFTTLTTLGYGDTIPTTTWTRMLANLEALVGLMYPAIYLARLVSLYSRSDR